MKSIKITLKILQFLLCVSALITKKLTDTAADRLSKRNQKLSIEWRLLSKLTWSEAGQDFSIVTYGGYTLITAIFLIGKIFERRPHNDLNEKLLLIIGAIFFFLEGFFAFESVQHIQEDLQTNAYILGSLSFVVAILFLIDACYKEDSIKQFNHEAQAVHLSMYNSR